MFSVLRSCGVFGNYFYVWLGKCLCNTVENYTSYEKLNGVALCPLVKWVLEVRRAGLNTEAGLYGELITVFMLVTLPLIISLIFTEAGLYGELITDLFSFSFHRSVSPHGWVNKGQLGHLENFQGTHFQMKRWTIDFLLKRVDKGLNLKIWIWKGTWFLQG